jgi:hypothetical protein
MSALVTGTILILGLTTPALAADNIALIVEPQIIQTGGVVKLTANNCKNTTASAIFRPSSLGEITLDQSIGNNSVSGSATIPEDATPGIYTITANCAGSNVTATQSLYVYHAAPAPKDAPNTGGIALGDGSDTIMIAAGVGLAGLGGIVGLLAWWRRRGNLVA